jgi:hypothetical protein
MQQLRTVLTSMCTVIHLSATCLHSPEDGAGACQGGELGRCPSSLGPVCHNARTVWSPCPTGHASAFHGPRHFLAGAGANYSRTQRLGQTIQQCHTAQACQRAPESGGDNGPGLCHAAAQSAPIVIGNNSRLHLLRLLQSQSLFSLL